MIRPLGDSLSEVTYLDHLGDDLVVVNAARVSMAKESQGDVIYEEVVDVDSRSIYTYEEHVPNEQDKKLITYLAKHKHWTPFSHPQIQLHIRMPIFVARQWFKHMVGFTRNEVSRRYVDDEPQFYIPEAWRLRAENVKQGSSSEIHPKSENISRVVNQVCLDALHAYDEMIINGVCPEQARMVLPQNMYTEFYETGSLAAYHRLCVLRLDPHAQLETRQYAEAVSKIIGDLFPDSWEALNGA